MNAFPPDMRSCFGRSTPPFLVSPICILIFVESFSPDNNYLVVSLGKKKKNHTYWAFPNEHTTNFAVRFWVVLLGGLIKKQGVLF